MGNQYILKMEDITVEFPGVKALDNVCFEAYRGEVHVLLGENGAGKSTIMKVLAGINTCYSGNVWFNGESIKCRSVQEQRECGVSMIFQEMNLLRNITVAENIFMGRQPIKKTGGVDWKKMMKDARALLDSIGSDISERMLVDYLSVGQMQMVEIAKSLSFDADIIIMDEPTSALTEKEVQKLFQIIQKLKEKNVAIVYISHRMEEIMQIADRITVLRDGQHIKTMMKDETNIDEIITMMVGRELSDYYPKVDVTPGEKLLDVSHLNQGKRLHDISFYARSGEITGFYGLMGAGRTELMRTVFGADSYDNGVIILNEKSVKVKSCQIAAKNGLALLTEDRKAQGLILEFDVNSNISLASIKKHMSKLGINHHKERLANQKMVEKIRIKTPSLGQLVRNLSGGNQQKVVIAKWLSTDAKIMIFDEPTRGIDVGSKVEIYKIMNNLKEEGKAVIMVSSELTECMGVSDRLYVMHEGRIMTCFEPEDMKNLTEEAVIRYATGSIQ
ncbi:MAG: sugar ABC transporter ATP-binding protein [Christensenellales bacterium]|jgi:ABC-type sugar transport system ATPase subunit